MNITTFSQSGDVGKGRTTHRLIDKHVTSIDLILDFTHINSTAKISSPHMLHREQQEIVKYV